MALYTDTNTRAVEALTSHTMDLVEALSTRTTFESVALACEEKGLITKALRQKLFDNNTSTPQTRAVELIDDVTNSVRFQTSCLHDFLCILTDRGGIPGRKVADLINDTYIDIENKMSTKIMTIGQHDNTPSPPRKRLSDDGHLIDNAKKFCFDKEANNNCDDPVCCLLKKKENEKILSQIPIDLVHLLYTESLIDRGTVKSYEENKEDKVQALLDDIHSHHKFQLLAGVLLRQESTIGIANEILGERHGEVWCEASNGRLQLRDCEEVCSPLVKDFMQLINDIISDMIDRNISPKDLLAFLQKIYIEPKLQIHSIKEIVKCVVTQKCSLVNISLLEVIVHHFGIKRAESLISQYKRKFEDISIDRPLSEFRPFCTSLLMCDRITIKLDKLFYNTSLASLDQLLSKVFDYFSKDVIVDSVFVKEEYVSVICYAPQYIGPTLQFELKTVTVPDSVREIVIGHFIAYKSERSEETMQNSQVTSNCLHQDFSIQSSSYLTQHSAYLGANSSLTPDLTDQQHSLAQGTYINPSVPNDSNGDLSITLDELCKGKRGYVCDPAYFLNVKNVNDELEVFRQLNDKVQEIFSKIQQERSQALDGFSFGLCAAPRAKGSEKNSSVWTKTYICNAFKPKHDGLVVFAVVSDVPKAKANEMSVIDYALYLLENMNKLHKENVQMIKPDNPRKTKCAAYVLFVSFCFTDASDKAAEPTTITLQSTDIARTIDFSGGACSYEEFCQGKPGFVCDKECLISFDKKSDVDQVKFDIANKISGIIKQHPTEVSSYSLGMASIEPSPGLQKTEFDPMDPKTWKFDDIRNKWKEHGTNNNVIIIAAISLDNVPRKYLKGVSESSKPYEFSLAIYQMLLHKFLLYEFDENISNMSFYLKNNKPCNAHAIYVCLLN